MLYPVSMLLAVFSSVVYHLVARAIPATVHPLVTMTVTYLGAAGICMALLPVFPLRADPRAALAQVNWTSIALAAAIVGIEVAFLLAYRAGWNISLAAIVANVSVTVVLLPVGVLAFKERLALPQVIGVALCVAGLILINRK